MPFPPRFRKASQKVSLCLLLLVAALAFSFSSLQKAPQEGSLFGEYIYYDFMDDYSSADGFNPKARFTRYTSYAKLLLNTDSTYSYWSVQNGSIFTSDSGSFHLQDSILTFNSEFGKRDVYHTTYGSEFVDPFIYVYNLEYIDLQVCDTNCLTVFFSHNIDSTLSYLEFGLGSKDRIVKLQGEFLPGKKSYYFKFPKKEWKEEELFRLSVKVPELHFAQEDQPDEFLSVLEDIKTGKADTLIFSISGRGERHWPLYREGKGALPQHLHDLKMLWEGERLYLRYKKKPERTQWVWDRKYNWLQKKRL